MLGILKKEIMTYLVKVFLLLPLLLFFEYVLGKSLHPITIIVNVVMFFVFVYAPMMIIEQNEEKSNAYVFLSTLPVTKKQIVGSKFLLVLLIITTVVFLNCLNISVVSNDVENNRILQTIFIIAGAITLISIGISYNGIFKLGYTRFLVFLGVFSIFLGLVPPILLSSGEFKAIDTFDKAFVYIKTVNWSYFISFSLLFYLTLMGTAICVFSFETKNKEVYFFDL